MPLMYRKSLTKFILLVLFFFAVSHTVYAVDVGVSASVGTITITPTDDGGGGIDTSVVFSGLAYPGATVHIWKDGIPSQVVMADANARFSVTLSETYNPSVLYTLYAIDKSGRRSLLINYPLVVKNGYVTQVSGIRFAPTITTDKSEVKFGDYITVSGYSVPNTYIDVVISGSVSSTYYVQSKPDGVYQITIPLIGFKKGAYDVYSNYQNDKKISKVIKFVIGDVNILSIDLTTNIPGDCNADQIINLVDFSVVAFWYGKPNPPKCVDTNSDKVINLTDFSILAFYWTG
jgi:hypothetical protein